MFTPLCHWSLSKCYLNHHTTVQDKGEVQSQLLRHFRFWYSVSSLQRSFFHFQNLKYCFNIPPFLCFECDEWKTKQNKQKKLWWICSVSHWAFSLRGCWCSMCFPNRSPLAQMLPCAVRVLVWGKTLSQHRIPVLRTFLKLVDESISLRVLLDIFTRKWFFRPYLLAYCQVNVLFSWATQHLI